MNSVQLIGNLGTTPILRHVDTSGKAVLNLSLAVDRTRKKDGKTIANTNWFDITLWGPQATYQAEHLSRGDLIGVQGELNARTWVDREGNKRHSVEVTAHTITWLKVQSTQIKNTKKATT